MKRRKTGQHRTCSTQRALELRFDGPIPRHLLESPADSARRHRSTERLLDRMAADYSGAVRTLLARTSRAWRENRLASADAHRAHLDAAARSLLSVLQIRLDWKQR